jgi:membrane associated rhomboid family serine protease
MIPYKDENPTHHIPYITYAIIVANVLVWILLQGMGLQPALEQSVCSYGAIPGALLGSASLSETGATFCPQLQQSWLTAFSSMFLHGSWLHLIGNMWFLWIFADNIEDALRPLKFMIFYLLGGIAAVAAQIISDPNSLIPMVGASGAIGGIMGAYARLFPKVRVHIAVILGFYVMRHTIAAMWMLGLWLGMQALSAVLAAESGQQGGVAFWAHIGGFATGFILIKFFYTDAKPAMRGV